MYVLIYPKDVSTKYAMYLMGLLGEKLQRVEHDVLLFHSVTNQFHQPDHVRVVSLCDELEALDRFVVPAHLADDLSNPELLEGLQCNVLFILHL